jgi:hypothetical protein
LINFAESGLYKILGSAVNTHLTDFCISSIQGNHLCAYHTTQIAAVASLYHRQIAFSIHPAKAHIYPESIGIRLLSK